MKQTLLLLSLFIATWLCAQDYTQQGPKLIGTGPAGPAYRGCSVSLSADGNTAIVGGSRDSLYTGAAWIFTRTDTTWTQAARLIDTSARGSTGAPWDRALQ